MASRKKQPDRSGTNGSLLAAKQGSISTTREIWTQTVPWSWVCVVGGAVVLGTVMIDDFPIAMKTRTGWYQIV